MELGITPIVTSGMIMQLLAGANLIDVDFGLKEDRACSVAPRNVSRISFPFVSSPLRYDHPRCYVCAPFPPLASCAYSTLTDKSSS